MNSLPAGIDCGADCSEDYLSGTLVELSATPESMSAFAGWSGACSGTGTCVVSMSSARSVTATFQSKFAPEVMVHEDALGSGWQNWSWDGSFDLAATSPPRTGSTYVVNATFLAWGGFSPAQVTEWACSLSRVGEFPYRQKSRTWHKIVMATFSTTSFEGVGALVSRQNLTSRRLSAVVLASTVLVSTAPTCFALAPPQATQQVLSSGGGHATGSEITLDATIGQAVAGASSGGDAAFAAGYWGPPLLDADWTWCAVADGASLLLNRTYRPRIDVATAGTVACIRVVRTDAAHPDTIPGIEPAHFWALSTEDGSGAAGNACVVALTFPHPGLADPHVCRSVGDGTWDCAQSSFTASDVTREGVTELSDWAVSEGFVVPVELFSFTVE